MMQKARFWKKEIWLTIFIALLVFYFMTISKMPGKITGAHAVNEYTQCEWDSLKDEFYIQEVLTLELDKYFYSERPLTFYAYSNDGEINLNENLLVFFPAKEYSTATIIAKNEGASCSKTIKIVNSV